MNNLLIVFAREPVPGKVKTRLQAGLSESRCAGLYKAFLKDILALVRPLKGVSRAIAFDSGASSPKYLKSIGSGFTFYKQKKGDLGLRMHDAFKWAKKRGSAKALIIGSDSPNLPARYIKDAFKLLERKDIVLGPSQDGGYYLIGLKEPCLGIFRGIKWGRPDVLKETLVKAGGFDKRVVLLPEWYDVDCPRGLARLKDDLKKEKKGASWTRRFLRI